jgi:SAM-dependent methyltransferase
MSDKELSFTGERFLPSCEREIWYEHFHRYTMALHWVKGAKVLDAACGEGYGSSLLADLAETVIGVDLSEEAIGHAQKNYQKSNLKFVQSNVLNMEFEDNSFDVVVSFETLEHLTEHEELIKEFKRVLKPEGKLIISTPDKKEYSDKTGFDNEYHLKELYRPEFEELIKSFFDYFDCYGQKLMFSSVIWNLNSQLNTVQFDCLDDDNRISNQPLFNPVYLITIASNQALKDQQKDFFSFTEQAEQVYGHYNAVIRAHIKAENDCIALQKKHDKWLKHPIIGRCIKWFGKQ